MDPHAVIAPPSLRTWLRLVLLLAGGLGLTLVLAALVLPALAPLSRPAAAAPDALVTAAAAAALGCCWLWGLATGTAFAVRLARQQSNGRRGPGHPLPAPVPGRTPRAVRLVVAVALGVPVLATGTAHAATRSDAGPVLPLPGTAPSPSASATPVDLDAAAPGVLDGLPLPERPDTGPSVTPAAVPQQRVVPRSARPLPASVLVQPGDSLWSIAADRLCRPGAPTTAVADAVRLLEAANRDRLGADPDLIFPGTRLELPRTTTTREDHR